MYATKTPEAAENVVPFPQEGTDERAEKEKSFKPDDDQIAIELAEALTGKVAFFHGDWRVWEQTHWERRDSHEVRRYIRQELRSFRRRGIGVSQARIKSLESMLEDDLIINDRLIMERQAAHRRYVPLKNGLFNLETFELEPHDPDLYFTSCLDFEYDEDAECPNFLRYLRSSLVHPGTTETDHTLVTLAIEALAYSMTARTDMKASFWMVGEKDSGKSTYVTLVKAIMGNYYGTIDLTQLGTNRFLLSGIVGKRVIAFTENQGSALLPDALYKALVGGSDEIYADVKNRDPITFRPECKVIWAMNDMPRISDRSGATTRRIVIIPFNRTIPERERIAGLEQLLIAERAGIFNQMVIHYKRIMRAGGFTRCEQSEERRRAYVLENDIEAQYAEERFDRHESHKVVSSELYNDYRSWCEQFGYRPKSATQVAAEWRRLGLKDSKSDGRTLWRGAKLRTAKTIAESL